MSLNEAINFIKCKNRDNRIGSITLSIRLSV